MFQFGIGALFANPIGGNEAANPTPNSVMTIIDCSIDISQDLKELIGQYKFPDDVAPGTMKVSGKFTFGRVQYAMFNQIFFGDAQTSNVKVIQNREVHSVPAASPYTVTVTNSAQFDTDLGVQYASNGSGFVRVTGTPTQGQYAVSAGVYTFSAADEGVSVWINYVYTPVTAVGNTYEVNQQLMGYGPVFELWLSEPYQSVGGVPNGVHLFACRASKLGHDLKNEDYLKPEIDFMAYANAAGQVGEFFQVAL
jgi:hypothetical protein